VSDLQRPCHDSNSALTARLRVTTLLAACSHAFLVIPCDPPEKPFLITREQSRDDRTNHYATFCSGSSTKSNQAAPASHASLLKFVSCQIVRCPRRLWLAAVSIDSDCVLAGGWSIGVSGGVQAWSSCLLIQTGPPRVTCKRTLFPRTLVPPWCGTKFFGEIFFGDFGPTRFFCFCLFRMNFASGAPLPDSFKRPPGGTA